MSDVSTPSGGPGLPGGSVQNTVQAVTSTTLIKFVGDIDIVTAGGGSTLGNTLDISGSLSLEPGESFVLSYDFSAAILGGGTFSYTVTGTTNFGGNVQTVTSSDSVSGVGSFDFNFSELGFVAEESVSGTWTGQLSFDWTDIPADSELNVTIPNDSIDFEVTSVPEPSLGMLALLGSLSLIGRRRR